MDAETTRHILEFWFGDLGPEGEVAPDKQRQWWSKSAEFDALCREQFEGDLAKARAGTLLPPKDDARGALAFIILSDQLSRNMYRDTPEAFASDPLALAVTMDLIESGRLAELSPVEKSFALMPLMHSEELSVHELSMEQFTKLQLEGRDNLSFAERHRDIIERFGRYPHRNAILGRESSPEELAFLQQPGSSF